MRSLPLVAYALLSGCVGELETTGGSDIPPPNAEVNAGCALGCHGTDNTSAPPVGIMMQTETTNVGVGAHRAHLATTGSEWHRPVACADCHAVPAEVGTPGHLDGDRKAEVTFATNAQPASWNGTTCTTGCHGSPAWGGTQTTPTWTKVDGSQSTCGSCHGAPPPSPHPTGTNCASCHPTMEDNSLTFRDPSRHIDGVIDVVGAGSTGGCSSCHGSAINAAPPRDLAGNTARTAPGVGAHQAHLADSTWRKAIVCSSCHVVPTTSDTPGHRDGDNVAELTFDTMNPAGVYTKATTSCSTNYCHGNGRGNNGTISWLATGPLACTSCHPTNGTGMSGDHRLHIGEENMRCSQCHGDVVTQNMTILNAALHVNGVHEVKMLNGTYNATTRSCSNTGCHGTETW